MKIHLIGIGGIGVSALAQYYLAKGHQVSGSDLAASEITDLAKEKGVKIIIGNSAENIQPDLDLVVRSPAVKTDNPEFKKARELGIKTQSYPEALGELTKEYYTIAVAGSHGKSTATAMIALALAEAGLDPTVIVGTLVKEFGGSNFRAGKSKFLVIEACEYDSSFLHYWPQIIVVTNVDKEHLDYFKTFANVKKAFRDFIKKLPKGGFLVDKESRKDFARIKKVIKVPGKHNLANASMALQVARILAIPDKITFSALSKFHGTWRRFEIREGIAGNKEITVLSDYAHHPNEISVTLASVREKYPKKRIICVFQPHQHQRTFYLFNDFVKVFRKAKTDNIILTDIYDVAGRETAEINKEVSSEKLANKINKKNISYLPMDRLEDYIKQNINFGDVLVIMGAGDIYRLADRF